MTTIKPITLSVDKENGIAKIVLKGTLIKQSKSLSDEGCVFLDSLGADVVLHFDDEKKLTEIELMGFDF